VAIGAAVLVALVALEHFWFFVLESFLYTRPIGLQTFRQSEQKARDSAALAANQGVYNAFLAAGLVWSLFAAPPAFAFQLKVFFLGCVIVAGVVGAATVSRRILALQALPAAIALVLVWLAR
jgi:putative membrane protein